MKQQIFLLMYLVYDFITHTDMDILIVQFPACCLVQKRTISVLLSFSSSLFVLINMPILLMQASCDCLHDTNELVLFGLKNGLLII